MEVFVVIAVLISGASLLSIAWIWGCLVDVICTPNGPRSLIRATVINCIVCVLVYGVCAKLLDASPVLILLAAFCSGMASLVQPAFRLVNHATTASLARLRAPLIEECIGKHFEELDANKDGLITELDLDDAIVHGRSKYCEPAMFRDLMQMALDEIAILGHVIWTEEHLEPFTTFTGSMPVTTVVNQVTYVYGISRGDQVGFAKKIIDRYKNW